MLVDLQSGEIIHEIPRDGLRFNLSPNGEAMTIGDRILSTKTGEEVATYDWWYNLGFTHDSSAVLALAYQHRYAGRSTVLLVDAKSGQLISHMSLDPLDPEEIATLPPSAEIRSAAVGNEGVLLGTTPPAKDADPTDMPVTINYKPVQARVAAISPDKKLLATADIRSGPNDKYDMTVRLWDFESGQLIRKFRRDSNSGWVHDLKFNHDGTQILVTGRDAEVWSVSQGELLYALGKGANRSKLGAIENARFVDSENAILVTYDNGNIRLFSVPDNELLVTYQGSHLGKATGAAYLKSKGIVLSVGDDAIIRLFDAQSGKQKLRYMPHSKSNWAAIDVDGRFDSSKEISDSFIWVYQDRIYTLDQLRDEYYEPNIIAKYLGTNPEPLQDVSSLQKPKAYPEVTIVASDNENMVEIVIKDQGDGIGKVPVIINGRELTANARELSANQGKKVVDGELHLTVKLEGDKRLRSTNSITARAFAKDDYIAGRGNEIKFAGFGVDEPVNKTTKLHAVIVGVTDYRGDKMDLSYAAKDAEDFGSAIKIAAGRLLGEANTNITLLTTNSDAANTLPTRRNILNALNRLKEVSPNDIIVLYFSGHGIIHRGKEDYYYLTSTAASFNLSSSKIRTRDAISSDEFAEILREIPVEKRVVIFDTCGAGQVISEFTKERAIPSSQIRALDRLNRRTGFHILAGSASDKVSYESSRFSQGLLTLTLLRGMQGAALRNGEFVDIVPLFEYSLDQVPILAKGIGGIQRPLYASPEKGGSFDIGRLEQADLERIVVQDDRPVFVRSSMIHTKNFNDRKLSLSRVVNEVLINAAQPDKKTGRSQLIYVDSDIYPKSYQVSGPYREESGQIIVRLTLQDANLSVINEQRVVGDKKNIASLIAQQTLELVQPLLDPN